jgi:hypothetical protein
MPKSKNKAIGEASEKRIKEIDRERETERETERDREREREKGRKVERRQLCKKEKEI